MARHLDLRSVGGTLQPQFRKATVLGEGIQVLSDRELGKLLHQFHYSNPDSIFTRFLAAKKNLQETFGGTVELIHDQSGITRIAAKLEFFTTHLRLDEDLHRLVVGMGFDLRLHHLADEHVYHISEGRQHSYREISSIATVADDLLRLALMLENFPVASVRGQTASDGQVTGQVPHLRLVGSAAALAILP
ncbi:Uncharacterised protein [Candidatus Bilamarchaeum dharawalense]|uniref:Uncharacterized protein n=1 Tax=Candidatus Bilamarchaeum dharawalense TaxID=2885759 RepID=A0A5E4LXH0_9ARCH|nr:Uncharacterised protein [Candidatus Bilamarchaeum dharawalense]